MQDNSASGGWLGSFEDSSATHGSSKIQSADVDFSGEAISENDGIFGI